MKSAPAPRLRPKDQYVETLRGLAVVIVVAGHAIGSDGTGGMKVADDSLWRYLFHSFNYIGIPLFTAIAGWVYALRPVRRGGAGVFLAKKARRLLLPMIAVGTLYFLTQYVTPGTNRHGVLAEMWKIYVLPYTVYWYLPSLFLLFCFTALVDLRSACGSVRAWGGWLLAALVGVVAERWLSPNCPNVFGVWGALCLLPYFLLGLGLRRFGSLLASPPVKRVYLAGLLAGFAVRQFAWAAGDTELPRELFLHVPIGMLTSACLLTSGWHNRAFVWIGSYAYGIYLFHAFGTGAGRILLLRLGIGSDAAIFLFSALLGLCAPIVVERALCRFPLLRTLFLGEKYMPESGGRPCGRR